MGGTCTCATVGLGRFRRTVLRVKRPRVLLQEFCSGGPQGPAPADDPTVALRGVSTQGQETDSKSPAPRVTIVCSGGPQGPCRRSDRGTEGSQRLHVRHGWSRCENPRRLFPFPLRAARQSLNDRMNTPVGGPGPHDVDRPERGQVRRRSSVVFNSCLIQSQEQNINMSGRAGNHVLPVTVSQCNCGPVADIRRLCISSICSLSDRGGGGTKSELLHSSWALDLCRCHQVGPHFE